MFGNISKLDKIGKIVQNTARETTSCCLNSTRMGSFRRATIPLTFAELRRSLLVAGPPDGYPKRQLPMWHRYRVELYPHYGQGSGIRDPLGYELKFPSAFRLSRRGGRPRGIVKIVR